MQAEYQKRSSAQPQLRLPVGEGGAKLRQPESKFRIGGIACENAEYSGQRIAGFRANAVLDRQPCSSQEHNVGQVAIGEKSGRNKVGQNPHRCTVIRILHWWQCMKLIVG